MLLPKTFPIMLTQFCWIIMTLVVLLTCYKNSKGGSRIEDTANDFYRIIEYDRENESIHVDSTENKSLSTKEELKYYCPTYESLNTISIELKSSCPKVPKYPAFYDSSFMAIYPPGFPGPSEQTQGFKHIFMATAWLNKRFFTLKKYSNNF